ACDRRQARIRGRQRQDDRRRFRGGFARPARVARRLFHPQPVAHVAFDGHVFLFGGSGDGRATGQGSFAVALQPLVGVAGGVVGPGAVDLGQRLALARFAADRGQGGVDWDGEQHDRVRFGGGFARPARVARRLFHPQLVARVAFDGHVFLFRGSRDGRAAGQGSFAVALQPLVGEAGGGVGAGAVGLGQRFARARFAGDRGQAGVRGRQRQDDRGRFGGGGFARAEGIASF